MTDKIDVEKVAKLARLKLNKMEETYFADKFNDILTYVSAISEVNLDDDIMEKDESLQKIFHADIPKKSPVSPDQFSEYTENKFFKVPKVIE